MDQAAANRRRRLAGDDDKMKMIADFEERRSPI
jgi:hypothetical protein